MGDLPVEEEYLKYGIAVVKYLGVEEPTPNGLFEIQKKKKR